MKSMLVLSAAIAASLGAPAALAQQARLHSVALGKAELNVGTPAEADALVQRIRDGMRPFCIHNRSYRTISSCLHDVTQNAIRQLDMPELAQALNRTAPPSPAAPPIMLAQR